MLPVSIVIVSYGSHSFLPDCLASLFENIRTYPTARVLLVENKTDPASLELTNRAVRPFLEQGLQFLAAPGNLGYGGAANWGWRQQGRAGLYLVLNPDMSFLPGWLAAFAAAFERDERIGVAGCKLLAGDGTIQHAGGYLRRDLALAEHFGASEPDDGRWDAGCEVEFVTGAALGLSRPAYERLGGFDPTYFPGYYEDIDLCRRAVQAGYKVWYEGRATACHYEGGSFGRGAGYYRPLHRNRLKFVSRHYTTRQLLGEFVPAERLRLQGTLDPEDRAACQAVYRAAAHSFLEVLTDPETLRTKTVDNLPGAEVYNPGYEAEEDPQAARLQRLVERLAEVKQGWLVREQPFHSKLPFVAALRERFNSISTRWYVRPILAQQVEYNAAVSRALEDLGQLALGQTATTNLQSAVLAARLVGLEERLERIEKLLERLAPNPPEKQV